MNDPLAQFNLVSNTYVPNVFPTHTAQYRLAIIGEAPGADEETHGIPFVGASGRLLNSILSSVGVARDSIYIGNVCGYRPPGNDLSTFGWQHPKVQSGLTTLKNDLATFKPNCILCLGNSPMRAISGKDYGVKDSGYSIGEYRGSILFNGEYKYIGAYHPAYVLRSYRDWPLLRWDTKRAADEALSSSLSLPIHSFELDLSPSEIIARLDTWPSGKVASLDIEGTIDHWICLSVVDRPNHGFIIAFSKYAEYEQAQVYQAVSQFLYRLDVPKVLQNALYEGFVLGYRFNMRVRNIVDDTMLKQWEIYPELEKGLDVQASIWTRQPQWKYLIAYSTKEQKKRAAAGVDAATELRNKYHACCIDSSVTLECSLAQDGILRDAPRNHYQFNVGLLRPLLYMEIRGISYDTVGAATELGQVEAALNECGARLTLRAGLDLRGKGGSLSDKKLPALLYDKLAYPVQKKGRGPDARRTTDVEALLNLSYKYPNDPILADILLHRKMESLRETLAITTDSDGRVRCAYNPVGTDTGRLTCYTSPTGSGANLQTVTKKLRKLYRADPGFHLFQCDLSGADGWTVAAHCARHGDSTMWDDYIFGLKPALIIVLLYQGKITNSTSRDEILALSSQYKQWEREHESESWLYFGCKRIQHATNYGVQPKTGVSQIMKDSYKLTGKPVYLPIPTFVELQNLYLIRYRGLYAWHEWARSQVFEGKNLTSASGHTRTFFGRHRSWDARRKCVSADHDTWKEFLADEPQENTTYATNLALCKLWSDPNNRHSLSNGRSDMVSGMQSMDVRRDHKSRRLIIEPLHQVHDALIGQFPIEHTAWTVSTIRTYFQNELEIAGRKVIIPFEGAYGPSWGELGSKYGGGDI